MKVIWVVGTPNGGTSCIAGMLHHLGVNMGEVSEKPTTREYTTFEDPRLREYKAKRFRDYLEMRLKTAQGRVGVKCGAWFWMEDPTPETLPVEVVFVHRPVEDSMRSSLRRHSPETKSVGAMRDIKGKVGGIGEAWAAREMLGLKIKPRLTLDFYRVLADPMRAAQRIENSLRLDCRTSQIHAARDFVNPALRRI